MAVAYPRHRHGRQPAACRIHLGADDQHFALQSAAVATTSEASSRTSIYLLSLSSSLVAIGFASQSPTAFAPLVATVLPAMVVLGILTLIRLVDISSEYRRCLIGIAHIRSYYRTLGPEAAEHFSPARGRWPEPGAPDPSLQLGAPSHTSRPPPRRSR